MGIISAIRQSIRASIRQSIGFASDLFSPAVLATLRQFALKPGQDPYYATQLDGVHYLYPRETHGTFRAPQPGMCGLFDGVNDYGSVSIPKPVTVSLWVNHPAPLVTFDRAFAIENEFSLFFDLSGNVYFYHATNLIGIYAGFLPDVKTHFLGTLEAGVAKLYVNGVLELSGASSSLTGTGALTIGAYSSGVQHWIGKIWDVRAYSVAKSAPEVAAIAVCDFTNLDKTGIIAGWYLNDADGTTARDWSGNGHDLTLSGPITEETFWAEDSAITANPFNVLGGTSLLTLTKSGGGSSWTDSVFSAPEALTTQALQIDLTVKTVSNNFYIGWGASPLNNFVGADFSIYLNNTSLKAAEGGSVSSSLATIAKNDTVSLRKSSGGVVTIYHNGVLIHTFVGSWSGTKYLNGSAFGVGDYGGSFVPSINGTPYLPEFSLTNFELTNAIIPRDESDITKDVQGNALGNTGLSPYPVRVDTPCITLDGVNDIVNLGDVSTSPTTISLAIKLASDDQEIMTLQNSTATAVTVVAGVLTFGGSLTVSAISVDGAIVSADAAGALLNDNEWHILSLTLTAISCSALRLGTDGSGFGAISVCMLELASGATKTFPMQEGPGTAVDNVTCYWFKTDGTYGAIASAIVDTTVATAWGTLCPGYVRDHAIEYGGRLGTLGEFVPLVPGTALCADGNVATLTAGHITNNPYSRADFDPFDAAELGALNAPSEFDSLPCVRGNGSDVSIAIPAITLTADFSITFNLKLGTVYDSMILGGGSYLGGADYQGFLRYVSGGWVLKVNGEVQKLAVTNSTIEDMQWHKIQVTRVGTLHTLLIDDVDVGNNVASVADFTIRSLLNSYLSYWTDANLSNLVVVNGSVTKYFPLTEGSGDDIVYYEAGVATIITNAIQGTLTNVWANKTEGKVDHTFPEAMRAILPRDTKFIAQDGTRAITLKEAVTGADLTNILDYVE